MISLSLALFTVVLASTIDIYLTKKTVLELKKLYPHKKSENLEMNELVKWFWKKFGVEQGTQYAKFITIPAILLITYFAYYEVPNIIYVFFGIYIIVIYIHLGNLQSIKTKEIEGIFCKNCDKLRKKIKEPNQPKTKKEKRNFSELGGKKE